VSLVISALPPAIASDNLSAKIRHALARFPSGSRVSVSFPTLMTGSLRRIRTYRGADAEFGWFDRWIRRGPVRVHLEACPQCRDRAAACYDRQASARFHTRANGLAARRVQHSKAEHFLLDNRGQFREAEYHFLIWAGLREGSALRRRVPLRARRAICFWLLAHHRPLARWGGDCPENFESVRLSVPRSPARGPPARRKEVFKRRVVLRRVFNAWSMRRAAGPGGGCAGLRARGFEGIAHSLLRACKELLSPLGAPRQGRGRLDRFSSVAAPEGRMHSNHWRRVPGARSGERHQGRPRSGVPAR